jgi:hypothetical protein
MTKDIEKLNLEIVRLCHSTIAPVYPRLVELPPDFQDVVYSFQYHFLHYAERIGTYSLTGPSVATMPREMAYLKSRSDALPEVIEMLLGIDRSTSPLVFEYWKKYHIDLIQYDVRAFTKMPPWQRTLVKLVCKPKFKVIEGIAELARKECEPSP